jgi:hypothetical protein
VERRALDGTWLALGVVGVAAAAATLRRGSRAWGDVDYPGNQIGIDLKYALWEWPMGVPGDTDWRRDLAAMRAAFTGTGPEVTVLTQPRKESNFGLVRIVRGGAEVHLWYPMEDANELYDLMGPMGLLELPDADRTRAEADLDAWFESHAGFGPNGEPLGARVHETIRERSFSKLMRAIAALDQEAPGMAESSSAVLHHFIQHKKIPRITGERWK